MTLAVAEALIPNNPIQSILNTTLIYQLLAVGRWGGGGPGTPVSSNRKTEFSSSFHRLDMTLAVAEALTPNKPKPITLY